MISNAAARAGISSGRPQALAAEPVLAALARRRAPVEAREAAASRPGCAAEMDSKHVAAAEAEAACGPPCSAAC